MNLAKTIGVGVAWTAVGSSLTKIIGVVYIALVLSQLSLYEFGLAELVITLPPLLAFLTLPGLDRVVISDMGRAKGENKMTEAMYILTSYFVLRCCLGVLAFILLFSGAGFIESHYNSAIANMIRVISFTFLFSPIRTIILSVLKVDLNFVAAASYRFIEELAKLCIVAVALLVFDLGPLAIIIAYVSTDVISISFLLPTFLRSWGSLFSGVAFGNGWRQPFYMLSNHGKWGVLETYLSLFGQNIRPWIIKFLLDTQTVGLYGVALGVYQHTASLLPISAVITPIIPRYVKDRSRFFKLLQSGVKYQLIASAFSAVAAVLLLPVLIQYFFPHYQGVYLLYIALLPALIPSSISSVLQPAFHALKAQKNLFGAAVMRVSLIVIILPITISFLGLWGIAVEFFCTRVLYSYERYRKLKKLVPLFCFKTSDLFRITETDRIIGKKILRQLRSFDVIKKLYAKS